MGLMHWNGCVTCDAVFSLLYNVMYTKCPCYSHHAGFVYRILVVLSLTELFVAVERARVLFPYKAENADELTLEEGQIIIILDKVST